MSEKLSSQPDLSSAIHTEIAGHEVAIVEAANGQQRYFEVDSDGKKSRIGGQALEAYISEELKDQAADQIEQDRQDALHKVYGQINDGLRRKHISDSWNEQDYRIHRVSGVSTEEVQSFGFKDYSELVKAAKDYAQEKAAERIKQNKAADKQARKDAARAHAEEWRKDVDAMREAAKPASEKLSYREKLLAGGDLGVKRMQAEENRAKERAATERVMMVPDTEMSDVARATAEGLKEMARQAGSGLKKTPQASYRDKLLAGGERGLELTGGVMHAPHRVEKVKGLNTSSAAELPELANSTGRVFEASKIDKLQPEDSDLELVDGVLDLDEEGLEDTPRPARAPAPKPAPSPAHMSGSRKRQPVAGRIPVSKKRRIGVRGAAAVAAGLAIIGGVFGLNRDSGESAAAAPAPAATAGLKGKAANWDTLNGGTAKAEAARSQAEKASSKIPTDLDLSNGRTVKAEAAAAKDVVTTAPLERGSNPWDWSRHMLESYDLPTTDANIDAVNREVTAYLGKIDFNRMPVGFNMPLFSQERVVNILGQYDNTSK